MKELQLLLLCLLLNFGLFAQNDSTALKESKFNIGIYSMPHFVVYKGPFVRKLTMDGSNIIGSGLISGIYFEYQLTEKTALRSGILFTQRRGKYLEVCDNPNLPFFSGCANADFGYYFKINENYTEFPISLKYNILKNKRGRKFNPYLLAGLSTVFLYKQEFIYIMDENEKPDFIEKGFSFKGWNLILSIGLNYSPTKKLSLYIEPSYGIIEGKSGHYISSYSPGYSLQLGMGIGIGFHF